MYFYQFSTMSGQIKLSHSINILSIQIDTKFNSNIKLSFFASHVKQSLKAAVQLLGTLEYTV